MRKALLCAAAVVLAACRKSGPPYGPKDALGTFRIEPGYRIEVFASEPDVVSPAAMEFDENGRIYVVEDRGYPLNTEGRIGRVKLLEDTNGDGIPDRSTIFAENLVMPTGVMRWKKGILVTDTPDVVYLEDTNGDGKADVKRVVLTGFAITNPQHTVNNPVYGLDNWIYLAHERAATAIIFKEQFGDRGSDIRYVDKPQVRLTDHDHNVRFRPDSFQLEALSGTSQFGQAFDEWGHHFTLNNSDHIRQEVIAGQYLRRNPDLPVASAMQNISDHGAAAKVFPITANPRFELLSDVGQFTSACGLTFYRGAFFVAEPAHNLVHRDLVSEAWATFTARRDRPNVEFLASTDAWFRPVNFTVGPDGALYLMDFYRLAIEHPEWMSTREHHSPDLIKGIDRGRIYRIVPDSGLELPKNIRLGSASDQELVKQLANPNVWWRRTAQRLLVDRKPAGAAPDLVKLFNESQSAVGRLHALWTLEGLGRLDDAVLEKALADPEPGVRENAVRLAETRPELHKKLLGMTGDPSAKVRFQLLATLGSVTGTEAAAAREKLLMRDVDDRWFQIAALSASSDEAPRLFAKAAGGEASEGRATLVRNICAVIGARRKPPEIHSVLARAASSPAPSADWWRVASMEGLAQGLGKGRSETPPDSQDLLLKLFASERAPGRRAALRLLEIAGLPSGPAADAALHRAAEIAADSGADPELRADQIAILALANPAQYADLLRRLIDPHQPEPVEEAAVRGFGRIPGDEVGTFLIRNWREMTPAVRMEAADALYHDQARVKLLLAAMEKGDIQPWTLAFRHRRQLIMNADPEIRAAGRRILDQPPGERQAVVNRYQAALDRSANAERGREVFRNVCSKCHRLDGIGSEVGPDLLTMRNKPKQVLLTDILIPSQSIAQGYEAYVVETANGTYDGVIGPQTSTTITLRHENGKEDVIQRKDIKNMYVTNLSAMPGDLEKEISPQQMADLLEYLKTGK